MAQKQRFPLVFPFQVDIIISFYRYLNCAAAIHNFGGGASVHVCSHIPGQSFPVIYGVHLYQTPGPERRDV